MTKIIIAAAISMFALQASAGVGPAGTQLGNNFDHVATENVTGATNPGAGGADKVREELSITAVDSDGQIADAKCTLTNSKGDWSVTVPDTVKVRRSDSDLQVKCEKPGHDTAVMTVQASTTQVRRPTFHFSTDSGGDGQDQDAMITVPQYAPSITVKFGTKQASAN